MKAIQMRWMWILGLGLLISPMSFAKDARVEIPVQGVFAPQEGYDDNDQVYAVIQGYLPNSCYSIGDVFADYLEDGETISISQYAVQQLDGVCATPDALPAHMKLPIPFSNEVYLGRLNAAEYDLSFKTASGLKTRRLKISAASKPTIDDLSYANVTGISMVDVVTTAESVKLRLTGVYTSTCTTLEDVKVVDQGDVIVLLPVLKLAPGVPCIAVLKPFDTSLDLGVRERGQYLLHVRSMNGKALNHLVTVQ